MKITWGLVKDIVTIFFALVGAILGVFNTVVAQRQARVRLIAKAKYAYMLSNLGDQGSPMACIEVTNMSQFPVFVSEIGFEIIGSQSRFAVTDPITTDRQRFARKLESRQSITGYFEQPRDRTGVAGRCYVRTESGEQFFGNMLGIES